MSTFLRQVATIAWKDVIAELRTKEMVSAMFVFAILAIVIFNFAFELRADNVALVAPGVLWVAFSFAGILGLNRSMVIEKDKGCLDGLMLCPVDRTAIYLGKMLGNLLFMVVVEVVALPIFAGLFNLPLLSAEVILVVFLGTLGFAAVGTLFSAVAVNTRTREVMLPVLLLPVIVPVVIGAVKATGVILDGGGLSTLVSWIQLLVAFDVVFLAVAIMVFEYVLEE